MERLSEAYAVLLGVLRSVGRAAFPGEARTCSPGAEHATRQLR